MIFVFAQGTLKPKTLWESSSQTERVPPHLDFLTNTDDKLYLLKQIGHDLIYGKDKD